jgi:hypothetical protein
MPLPISLPYTFANATTAIPLSNLDSDFTTLRDGINGIGNGTNALSNVVITGGTIDGTTIGATTSSTGRFSTVTATTGNITTINATTLNAATHRSDTSLTFQSNGITTAMTVDTSQNVGIGTVSPGYALQITRSAAPAYLANTDGTGTLLTGVNGSGLGVFGTFSNTSLAFFSNAAERMRIDTSGNVGIGTSSPDYPLTIFKSGSTDTYARFGNGAGSGLLVGVNTIGESLFYNANNAATLFATNGSERARISSAGVISIGTTGTNGGGKFYCYDDTTTGAFIGGFRAANASYASADQVNWVDRSASSAYSFFVARSNSDTNTSFNLRGDGNAYADGTWNNNGADYAEYFESATGAAIPVGTTVVLDGNKVRASTDQDAASLIMGVVRPKEPSIASMVVGNTAWNKWQGMFLTDDFGRYILEPHEVVEWDEVNDAGETEHKSYESHMVPSGVVVPENATRKSVDEKGNAFTHYKINPDYDPSHEYVSREERPEWLIIGLIGQVPVLTGQPIGDRWIKMRDVSASVSEYMIR